jgi:hypothetical protein
MQLETFVHRNLKQFVFHLSYWAVSDAAAPELEAFRDAYMQ